MRRVVFQLGYTTLFGWFATYLYLNTGSIFAPLSAHMFCNYMGIYLPTSAVARHPHHSLSECTRIFMSQYDS